MINFRKHAKCKFAFIWRFSSILEPSLAFRISCFFLMNRMLIKNQPTRNTNRRVSSCRRLISINPCFKLHFSNGIIHFPAENKNIPQFHRSKYISRVNILIGLRFRPWRSHKQYNRTRIHPNIRSRAHGANQRIQIVLWINYRLISAKVKYWSWQITLGKSINKLAPDRLSQIDYSIFGVFVWTVARTSAVCDRLFGDEIYSFDWFNND